MAAAIAPAQVVRPPLRSPARRPSPPHRSKNSCPWPGFATVPGACKAPSPARQCQGLGNASGYRRTESRANSTYVDVVDEDIAINVGGLFASWNPLSHGKYWTGNDFTKPAAEFIADFIPFSSGLPAVRCLAKTRAGV